jgi:hypothetical protein
VLGERIAPTNPNYQIYTCKPSEDFDEAIRCDHTQIKSGKAGNITVSSTLIQAQDGTALYIVTNAFPVSLSKAIVQNEIATLSTEINEKPASVEWLPKDAPNPTAVVVTWGQVRLDAVDYDAAIDSAQDKNPHLGELVDALGDPNRAAKERLPVYRIVGGAGYIYAASFGTATRGNRHYVAANARTSKSGCSPARSPTSSRRIRHWRRMTIVSGPTWLLSRAGFRSIPRLT